MARANIPEVPGCPSRGAWPATWPGTLAAGAIVSQTVYSLAATVWFSRFPQRRQIGHFDARVRSPPQTMSTAFCGIA